MKILFVIPRYNLTTEANYQYGFPLGLGYISSAMKNAGYKVDCLNLNHHAGAIKEIVSEQLNNQYDVVCSGHTGIGYAVIEKIVQASREHVSKPKVILGGALITSEPELMLNSLKPDVEVLGEGEITMVELLNAIENKKNLKEVKGIGFLVDGEPVFTPKREIIQDLNSLPLPDFEGFGFEEYLDNMSSDNLYGELDNPRTYPLLASRSCPFQCIEENQLLIFSRKPNNKIKTAEIGDKVMAFDEKNNCLVETTITNKREKEEELYEIELKDGKKLKLTKEHLIYTKKGWIKVKNLKKEDKILSIESNEKVSFNKKICNPMKKQEVVNKMIDTSRRRGWYEVSSKRMKQMQKEGKLRQDSPEQKLARHKSRNRGENNPMWKGENVGLVSLHNWVERHKPKPKFCEECKKNKPYDLANISQKYKRDINDFEWLCRKCHMKKDGRYYKWQWHKQK